jgi:hypothetical protein
MGSETLAVRDAWTVSDPANEVWLRSRLDAGQLDGGGCPGSRVKLRELTVMATWRGLCTV